MISNLQSLRAFAAISVVFFHIIGAAKSYNIPTSLLSMFSKWGAYGVDIFFVISGFIMLYTQIKNKRSFLDFYRSRLIRIVPAYWFLTTVVIFIFIALPHILRELIITPKSALSSYFFISQFLGLEFPIVYVGWTLEWEMLFYVIFGIGLLFNSWRYAYTFIFVALTIAAFVLSNPIVLEFLAGMLIAYFYNKDLLNKKIGGVSLAIGLSMLLLSMVPTSILSDLNRVIKWGIPSFFIVLGAVSSKQISMKPLTSLGNASYSIYLVQIISIPLFYKVITTMKFSINGDIASLLCLIFSVIAGVAMYTTVERPAINYLSHRKLISIKTRKRKYSILPTS